MGRVRAASLVLAALAVGLLLAACGGSSNDKLLPAPTADQINSQLDQVRASHQEGNCEKAEEGVANVSTEVDELGQVDVKLKKAMRQAAAKLSEVVQSCKAKEEAAEEKSAEEQQVTEEEEQFEAEEEQAAEEEQQFEEEQKAEEKAQQAEEKAQEKAEKEAEQPGPPEEGEEFPPGKAKGHEKQEEIEPPSEGEEEVTPPSGGPAGGIGPGAEAGGEG
jgi:polyribonucleotide nucleotidyltransferase